MVTNFVFEKQDKIPGDEIAKIVPTSQKIDEFALAGVIIQFAKFLLILSLYLKSTIQVQREKNFMSLSHFQFYVITCCVPQIKY